MKPPRMKPGRFVDMLAQKECWFWCKLFWSPTEDIELQRIGDSPEEAYYAWEAKLPLVPFKDTEGLWEKQKTEAELKRGEMGIPEWLYWEEHEEGIVGAIYNSLEYDVHDDMPTWARWGLENGVAPFQPFLLRFPMPHYMKHYIWEYGCYEYDVEYDWDIMRALPWPKEKVLFQWERYLKSVEFNTCLTR